jgi:sporulation protein YlmC with PRC-barrel domain
MRTSLTRDLERLTSSGIELTDPAADLRGRDVRDRLGEEVGTVADVLVDPDEGEVRLIEVEAGGGLLGLGRKHHLVPLEALAGRDSRTVFVNAEREEILETPAYQPTEGDEEEAQYLAAYHAYGLSPYWEQRPPT